MKMKKGIVKRSPKQSGKVKDIMADKMLTALPPGLRVSASGKMYWETRKNRSDMKKSKKL